VQRYDAVAPRRAWYLAGWARALAATLAQAYLDAFGPRVEPPRATLRVMILVDSIQCHRGYFWDDIRPELERITRHTIELRPYPLANSAQFFVEEIEHYHVLVINWDAINGDPDFGSDVVLRWCEHRRREMMLWVHRGGVLIIEGQATMGVPTQRAYDAVLGPGELRVSGLEDALQPGLETKRSGRYGRMTSLARQAAPIKHLALQDLSSAHVTRTYDQMFPGVAGRLLTPERADRHPPEWNLLYRGWFAPRLPKLRGRSQLAWVPIAVTSRRKWYERPHSDQGAAFRERIGALQ
jgi:hypothetical protein